ncbi:MAG: 2-C-methyl-D-erythritol 4-phosphate cytidylyltransferase [Acidimicrobiales bacterium]
MWSVVVAAGRGTRFGGQKQFAMIRGRPMVDWSVAAARSVSDGVVLVVPSGDGRLSGEGARGADFVVAGGETRSSSVRAGIERVPAEAEVIVVHDGARPLASARLFREVVDAVANGADAAVPGIEPSDTLKRVDGDAVVDTLARDEVKAVQTPQAFKAGLLRSAHRSGAEATDDAGLVETLGATVRVVPGDPRNLKVTTPADLELVQALAGT